MTLKYLLSSGDTYVDVGANIGALALHASNIVGDQGAVYSIEPHPKTYKHMIENILLNKGEITNCINKGIGDKIGQLYFTDESQDDQNRIAQEGSLKVEVDTLDNLLKGVTRIDLLKIDVEGYEKFVLKGAESVLDNTQYLMIELAPSNFAKYDYSYKEIIDFLKNKGFHIYLYNHDKECLDKVEELQLNPDQILNVIAVQQ